MANVNDVARYILERQGESLSTMKLQKTRLLRTGLELGLGREAAV